MDICNLYLNMLDFKKILLLSMEDRKDMTLTLLYLLLIWKQALPKDMATLQLPN
jgi:hypothetical protein